MLTIKRFGKTYLASKKYLAILLLVAITLSTFNLQVFKPFTADAEVADANAIITLADFESGTNGFQESTSFTSTHMQTTATMNGTGVTGPAPAGSIVVSQETEKPLKGAGSLKVKPGALYCNYATALSTSLTGGESGYNGIVFRLSTNYNNQADIAFFGTTLFIKDKSGNEKQILLGKSGMAVKSDGSRTALYEDAYWGFNRITNNFDGYVFLPFENGNMAIPGNDPIPQDADFSSIRIGFSFMSHSNGYIDWNGATVLIDNVSMYKGTDVVKLAEMIQPANAKILSDFEKDAGSFVIDNVPFSAGTFYHVNAGDATVVQETAEPLIAKGSLKVGINSVSDYSNTSITGTLPGGTGGFDGISFRFKTTTTMPGWLAITAEANGNKTRLGANAIGIGIDGSTIPIPVETYWNVLKVPAGFDGYILLPFRFGAFNQTGANTEILPSTDLSSLKLNFSFVTVDATPGANQSVWNASTSSIDNIALYQGFAFPSLMDKLGGNNSTLLLTGFESSSETFNRATQWQLYNPWGGGDSPAIATITHETAHPLVKSGSLNISINNSNAQAGTDQSPTKEKYLTISNSTPLVGKKGYDGLVMRLKTDTGPYSSMAFYLLTKGSGGKPILLGGNAVAMNLQGQTSELTMDSNTNLCQIPTGFDGYIFLPFSGAVNTGWSNLVTETTDFSEINLCFYYYNYTWDNTTSIFDSVALYKGEDLIKAANEIGGVNVDDGGYKAPKILADFETGTNSYREENTRKGEYGAAPGTTTIERDAANSLIGTGSLRVDVNAFDWVKNYVAAPENWLSGAFGYDGICLRLKTDASKAGKLGFEVQTKDFTATQLSLLGMNAVALKKNGTQLVLEPWLTNGQSIIPAKFDGWIFLPFDGAQPHDWNTVLGPMNDYSGLKLILNFFQLDEAVWQDTSTFIDNIALYSGTDYYKITSELGDEVKIPEFGDAILEKLFLNGRELDGFDSNTFEYDVPIADEFSPAITGDALNPDAEIIVKNQDRNLPCTTVVTVSTPSGECTYTLNFTQATGNVDAVEYVQKITAPKGTDFTSLNLPHRVPVTLDNGVKTDVAVTWLSDNYNKSAPGVFEVIGILEDTLYVTNSRALNASIYVEVSDIQKEFYVSATAAAGGNGSQSQPFKTLQEAKTAVRPFASNMTGDIVIYLMDGTYNQDTTLTFSAADSGTNDFNVVYKVFEGAKPVISGGKQITGWSLHDSSLGIYKAKVPDGFETRNVFVNGKRAQRARGDLEPLIIGNKDTKKYTLPASGPYAQMGSWKNVSDIQFVMLTEPDWRHSFQSVASISGREVTMQDDYFSNTILGGRTSYNVGYAENAYELLVTPGDWYLDKTDDYLYYIPRAGENMSSATIMAGALDKIIEAQGTIDSPVHNIVFDGLTFSYSNFSPASTAQGYDDLQTNITKTYTVTGAISFTTSDNILIQNCDFTHLGSAALYFESGSSNNVINNNTFSDISANGITIGGIGVNDHHPSDPRYVVEAYTISNNTFTTVGAEFFDSVPILLGYTRDCVVSHNTMYNLPYSGICTGWGWGWMDEPTSQTIAGNNVIAYNLIYDYMNTLWDGGAIYNLGDQPGTVIAYNYMYGQRTYSAYLYPDCASRYMKLFSNVIDGTKRTDTDGFNTWYLPNYYSGDPSYSGSSNPLLLSHDLVCVNNYITDNLFKFMEKEPSRYIEGVNCISEPNFKISNNNWPRIAKNIMKYAGANAVFNEIPLVERETGIELGAVGAAIKAGTYLGIEKLTASDTEKKNALSFGKKAKIIAIYDAYITKADGIQEMAFRGAATLSFPAIKGLSGNDMIICSVSEDGSLERIDPITSDEKGVTILLNRLGKYAVVSLADIGDGDGSIDDGDTGSIPNTGVTGSILTLIALLASFLAMLILFRRRKKA